MQDFSDEKKLFKLATLDFISARFVMGYPCVRHFGLYSWSRYFALFLSYVNITKLLKFSMAGLMGWLSDIAEHLNYQIERKFDGNFFMKRANEHFVVSGRCN